MNRLNFLLVLFGLGVGLWAVALGSTRWDQVAQILGRIG